MTLRSAATVTSGRLSMRTVGEIGIIASMPGSSCGSVRLCTTPRVSVETASNSGPPSPGVCCSTFTNRDR